VTSGRSTSTVGALLRAAVGERRQAKRNTLRTNSPSRRRASPVDDAAVEGERRTVEADLGPVKYLATLLGQADEVMLRWFILTVALLLDPAAVLLLLAVTRTTPRPITPDCGRPDPR
jgi:hypothetical protein